MEITEELLLNQEENYKKFSEKLIPNIDNIIGVRAPIAKNIAKKYVNTDIGERFLKKLPHKYHEENMVHAYMLGFLKKDIDVTKEYIRDFLPYIDNWAVCDSCCAGLKRFFKKPECVFDFIKELALSKDTYTVRFALVSMAFSYINEKFIEDVLEIAEKIKNDEYYVKMAQAWLIAEALVKQYDKAIKLIEAKTLPAWIHNKSITKARESYRIDDTKKEYLKSLRVKEKR